VAGIRRALACTALLAFAGCRTTAEPARQDPNVLEITIRSDDPRQTIHSFGASDAWSIQFVGRDWPVEKRDRIADLLFSLDLDPDGSPMGIGLSAWRFNLGAGSAGQGDQSGIRDEWRRAESFLLPDGTYDWTRLAGQRWFLRAASERGVREFIAFVNSPPVALTRNGRAHSSGGDASNLAPDRYHDFARYLRDAIAHLGTAEGVQFDYLSPVNEPQWDWDGGQEGSPWLNSEISAVVREISSALDEAGLATQIEITEAGKLNYLYEVADRPGRGDQAETFFAPTSPHYLGDLSNVAPAVAGHSYFTTHGTGSLLEVRSALRQRLDTLHPTLEFRMSEYCVLEDNPEIQGRGRDLGMNTALYVARVIHADLVVGEASSWHWWLAVSPYDYKDGLVYIDLSKSDGDIYESKLLWGLGHFSRFIRPGMRRVEVGRSDGLTPPQSIEGTLVSAYRHPETSETVVVVVNQGQTETRLRVGGGGVAEYRLYLTTPEPGVDLRYMGSRESAEDLVLPPRSMATLVAHSFR
jgi:O-glycosyl hydrolase